MAGPNVALAVAENETVTAQVGAHGLLVKPAVTPVGSPDADHITSVVIPDASVAVIEDVGLVEPWTTVRLLGDGVERLKSKGAGETVSDSVVEWVAPPPFVLIVTVEVPVAALIVAEKDTVTMHVGLHGLFVKVEVTPLGRVDVENVTGVVAPVARVAVMDDVGLVPPWTTVRLPGEGEERLKPKPGAATVSDSVLE